MSSHAYPMIDNDDDDWTSVDHNDGIDTSGYVEGFNEEFYYYEPISRPKKTSEENERFKMITSSFNHSSNSVTFGTSSMFGVANVYPLKMRVLEKLAGFKVVEMLYCSPLVILVASGHTYGILYTYLSSY